MNVKQYMIKTALEIANNNRYGYSNAWPNNKFGEGAAPYDGDCGAFCSYCLNQALKQIGINTNEYYEPQGGTAIYNEAYLLKYCDRYSYQGTRNQPGDILISGGHTVMVTACGSDYTQDTITHASQDLDGRSGDSSGREVCSRTLYDGGWRYIYRLKDKYNKEIGGDPTPAPSTNKKGVDISHHNGNIDFAKVKQAGISFIIHRDGWGEDGLDTKFVDNVKNAKANGIEVPGVYHFIYAANENQVIENAQKAIANVEKAGLPKTTIIWCDLEYDTVDNARDYRGTELTPAMQRKFVQVFCDYILSQGYPTGAYVNQDYMSRVYGTDFGKYYDLWLADLEGDAAYQCVYRQTSFNGNISGISGAVDTDEFYGQYTAGTAKPKTDPTPAPTPTPTPDTIDTLTLALQIYAGKWGNNPERQKKITEKYGDAKYQEAQTKVNAICKQMELYKLYTSLAAQIWSGAWGNNPDRYNSISKYYGAKAYEMAQGYVNNYKADDILNGYKVANEILCGQWGNNPDRYNGIVNNYNKNVYTIAQDIVNHVL